MTKIPGLPDQPLHLTKKCSLILRLWQSENSTGQNWRASVEIPEDGERFGFSSLEQLFAFLVDYTETSCNLQLVAKRKGELKKVDD